MRTLRNSSWIRIISLVMVSSILHDGDVDGDGMPDETLELAFDGAKLTYPQFDDRGKPLGQTTGEW